MKKIIYLAAIFIFLTPAWSQQSENSEIIELPIEMVAGYGPFNPGYSFLKLEDRLSGSPFKKIKVEVTGIPDDWENPSVQQITFDFFQQLYQNYKQGNLEEKFFNHLSESWNIDLKNLELSAIPIKSFSHVVLTRLETGEILYKIDTNNDRDFSDEEVFKPVKQARSRELSDSNSIHNSHLVDGEIVVNNQVKQVQFPVYIIKGLEKFYGDAIMQSFPQYAQTEFLGESLAISSGFAKPSFRMKSDLIVLDETKSIRNIKIIEKNEFLEIKGQTFQNLGVDYGRQILKLKKIVETENLTSTQRGYKAIPFGGNEFTTGEPIRLEDYQGKFLYVEFWGTWCGPCIQELPNMKAAYEKLDKSKIEFLGVAARDKPETLRKFLDKKGIPWPQLLSNEQNDIVDLYGVQGFPSSFLINDQGEIVAKDLRGGWFV